jgi:hypothetical protein
MSDKIKKTFDAVPTNKEKLLKRLKKEKLDHLELFVVVEELKHWKEKKLAVKHPKFGKPGWCEWITFKIMLSGNISRSDSYGSKITVIERYGDLHACV